MPQKNIAITVTEITLDRATNEYLFCCQKPEQTFTEQRYKSQLFYSLQQMLSHSPQLLQLFGPRIGRERARLQNKIAAFSHL
jgi:hypothetical protein